MSRKSRRTNKRGRRYSTRVQRDKYYISTPNYRVLDPLHKDTIYDKRRFHPKNRFQEALSISGEIARTSYNSRHLNKVKNFFKPPKPRFLDSRRSIICRRRWDRQRVLFALAKIGRGKRGSGARRRYTEDSKIVCTRR